MKLVEVVILLGSQCISPLQHADQATLAAKVPCAVLIHRDSVSDAVTVVPGGGAVLPEVRVALERMVASGPAGTKGSGQLSEADRAISFKDSARLMAEADSASGVTVEQVTPQPIAKISDRYTEIPRQDDAALPEAAMPEPEAEPAQQDAAASARPERDPIWRRIVLRYPQNASAGKPTADAEPPVVETPEAVAEPAAAEPPAPEPPKAKPASTRKTKSASKPSSRKATTAKAEAGPAGFKDRCGKTRVARWYTNKAGQKKYRCVVSLY